MIKRVVKKQNLHIYLSYHIYHLSVTNCNPICLTKASLKVHEACFLIHEADPQSRQVVIIVFAPVCFCRPFFRPSVPTFQNKTNETKTTGDTVGLAE